MPRNLKHNVQSSLFASESKADAFVLSVSHVSGPKLTEFAASLGHRKSIRKSEKVLFSFWHTSYLIVLGTQSRDEGRWELSA